VVAVLLGPIHPKKYPDDFRKGTLTKVIFEGIQIWKLMIPVNQTQKVDEKNGIMCLFSKNNLRLLKEL